MITCTKCKHIKPKTSFKADKRRKGGLGSWCRDCDRALGWFKDDVSILEKAIKYLTELGVI